MCLEYKNVESLEKPELVEEVPQGAYLRKNITTRSKDDVVTYCYEECFVPTDEYEKTETYRVTKLNKSLQNQINELELKRIRAFVEPGIKDETTGETWLAYRTAQIEELRKQMT